MTTSRTAQSMTPPRPGSVAQPSQTRVHHRHTCAVPAGAGTAHRCEGGSGGQTADLGVDPGTDGRQVTVDRRSGRTGRAVVTGTAGGTDQLPAAGDHPDLRATGVAVACASVTVRVVR